MPYKSTLENSKGDFSDDEDTMSKMNVKSTGKNESEKSTSVNSRYFI